MSAIGTWGHYWRRVARHRQGIVLLCSPTEGPGDQDMTPMAWRCSTYRDTGWTDAQGLPCRLQCPSTASVSSFTWARWQLPAWPITSVTASSTGGRLEHTRSFTRLSHSLVCGRVPLEQYATGSCTPLPRIRVGIPWLYDTRAPGGAILPCADPLSCLPGLGLGCRLRSRT